MFEILMKYEMNLPLYNYLIKLINLNTYFVSQKFASTYFYFI